MPVPLGWWAMVTKAWSPAWKGPVFDVLCSMWAAGMRLPDDDKRLALAAGVPLRAWKSIREGVGDFFTVEGATVTQSILAAKYEAAMARSEKFRTRNAGNATKGWETRKARKVEGVQWTHPDANGIANRNANGNANGIASGYAKTMPLAGDRAYRRDLDLSPDLKKREGSNAIAVPDDDTPLEPPTLTPDHPRVTRVLKAYPKTRQLDQGIESVHIGDTAREQVAAFMTANPDYPLLFVVERYARGTKRPMNLRAFLDDPPARETWEEAWLAMRKTLVGELRGLVQDLEEDPHADG